MSHFQSGDSDPIRNQQLIGVRDADGRRWCFECANEILRSGVSEPEFVEDLHWSNGHDRQAKCSSCQRRLIKVRG